jgi:hypothetical protein
MNKIQVSTFAELDPTRPSHALVANVDLVIVRWPDAEELREATGGIATQRPELRSRLDVELAAKRLTRFLRSATGLMRVMAAACGHTHLNQFTLDDLTTWKRDMHHLAGIPFGGVQP